MINEKSCKHVYNKGNSLLTLLVPEKVVRDLLHNPSSVKYAISLHVFHWSGHLSSIVFQSILFSYINLVNLFICLRNSQTSQHMHKIVHCIDLALQVQISHVTLTLQNTPSMFHTSLFHLAHSRHSYTSPLCRVPCVRWIPLS